MSSTALNWAKNVTVGSAAKKAVLLVLADYCDEEWSCFPSQARIAEEAEVGERTVRRILAEWQEQGLIRRERRPSKDGSGRSSDRIYVQPATLAARNDGRLGFQAATGAVQPATGDSSTGQALADEPLGNHQEPQELTLTLSPTPAAPTKQGVLAEFKVWYSAYPRKKKPDAAERAYVKARTQKGATADELLRGAEALARLVRSQGGDTTYVPYPASWLNDGQWREDLEDEIRREEDRRLRAAEQQFTGPAMRYG